MFSFSLLHETDLEQVINWRTAEHVTRFMLTDIEHDLDKQKRWFAKITNDPSCCYWLIRYQNQPVGLINIADIDLCSRSCSWGFYIGEIEKRNLGGLLPPFLYNFMFEFSSIETIIADVLETNVLVQKLHRMHGYIDMGLLPQTWYKEGKSIQMHRFSLKKACWQRHTRFHRFNAPFPIPDNLSLN